MNSELKVAEEICSRYFEMAIQLEMRAQLRSSERTRVYRCDVIGGPASVPATVIVKQTTRSYGATFDGAIDGNIWNDWAGLLFSAQLLTDDVHIPRCFGGDRGLIVLEDLGERHSLRDLLSETDAEQAAAALIKVFAVLGRLHAQSIGKEEIFLGLRRQIGDYDPTQEFYRCQNRRLLHKFQEIGHALDIVPHPQAERDITLAVARLEDPGPFHVFLHGDPSPANFLLSHDESCLIDFEYAGYGHALLEGCQARMLFPSSGYVARIPEPVIQDIEDAYRVELAKTCTAATDHQAFGEAFGAACAYWAINFAVWLPFSALLAGDTTWGSSSMRQRFIARSEIFSRTAAEFNCYQGLGESFKIIAAKLRRLWPEAADSMGSYPAFAAR